MMLSGALRDACYDQSRSTATELWSGFFFENCHETLPVTLQNYLSNQFQIDIRKSKHIIITSMGAPSWAAFNSNSWSPKAKAFCLCWKTQDVHQMLFICWASDTRRYKVGHRLRHYVNVSCLLGLVLSVGFLFIYSFDLVSWKQLNDGIDGGDWQTSSFDKLNHSSIGRG